MSDDIYTAKLEYDNTTLREALKIVRLHLNMDRTLGVVQYLIDDALAGKRHPSLGILPDPELESDW